MSESMSEPNEPVPAKPVPAKPVPSKFDQKPEPKAFATGDKVIHPKRPEWGAGRVEQAVKIKHKGQEAQKLTITFDHHGRVTINTGVAKLAPWSEADRYWAAMPAAPPAGALSTPRRPGAGRPGAATGGAAASGGEGSRSPRGKGWLGSLGEKKAMDELAQLPEAMTDPFASLPARLYATLDSYRFSGDFRRLIDWAIAQTGLEDPMTKYDRHDIEQAFEIFSQRRDAHLRQLVQLAKKSGEQAMLQAALQATHDEARDALSRILA